MIFEILNKFHHKMIEYKRKNFCKFQKMIFEILTKFHHKMIEYKRNNFFSISKDDLLNRH